jgi:16S rRNA (cytidine1402-2'-O)-methyltransferase
MLVIGGVDIGNRLDISPRVVEAISTFDMIVVENLASFSILCKELGISPKATILEYFSPMPEEKEKWVVERVMVSLRLRKKVLMLSDDGMPGIADPGGLIVDAAHSLGYKVSVFPGPSVVSTLPAVLGVDSRRFTFEDEIPSERASRLKLFQKLYAEGRGVVFIVKNRRDDNTGFKQILKDIALVFPERNVLGLGINMTMENELIIKTSVGKALSTLSDYTFSQKDFISLYLDCR